MKESFWSPAPSPTLSFGEQCKWDVDEWSEHQLVSLGCSKLQLWASGISPEQDQHKNCFLISRQPLQAALGIGWNFTDASVALKSSHLTLCTSQPTHASGSRGNSNLELSSSPPRRTPFPVCAKSLKSCPTLCDPMDCSPPGSSVHGNLQVRILERGALPSSKGSSRPRNLRKSLLRVIGCYALTFFVQLFIQVLAEHWLRDQS